MSEVDRLSNSGLYPALPIADRRSSKDDRESRERDGRPPGSAAPKDGESSANASPPRPPKSIIDEFA